MDSDTRNASIIYRKDLREGLWIVRVLPDDGVLDFIAGQYAELGLPLGDAHGGTKIIRRAYSIVTPPRIREYFEFFIARVDQGRLTPMLEKLSEGERLWIGPKIKGKFTLSDVPSEKDLVMVATGTGLAPYLSMFHQYRDTRRWRRFVLLYGARMAEDLAYHEELQELAAADSSLVYIPTVTREPDGSPWAGQRGRVQHVLVDQIYEQLVGAPLDPVQCQVFLCGNPQMIEQAQPMLEQKGFKKHSRRTPGNLHFERYW